jgi:DNA-binding MarR family transcriptional regulator
MSRPGVVAQQLQQDKPFSSLEEEVYLALLLAAQRITEPWAHHLRRRSGLTPNQYNVLRILRGAPAGLTCGDIGERMIARDPDITRLVDRLTRAGLVRRSRSTRDRRVVEVTITPEGLRALDDLDADVRRMPIALLGHLGPARLRQLKGLLGAVIANRGDLV